MSAGAQTISGVVVDKKDKQPLVGATVELEGENKALPTDLNGRFTIKGLKKKAYTLEVRYISYQTQRIAGVRPLPVAQDTVMTIELSQDEQALGQVTVTGTAKKSTVTSMVQMAKNSSVIVSNVSSQEITRNQDSNAGEVIKRVPGVSIIDGQFVMVRGLSQRYNNVWINGGAVPSSEADSRAFSFDIIPGSQIENMQIVKTPSPEYPADYSGGFIVINTKDMPSNNSMEVSVGGNWNDATHFADFRHGKASGTDFLGFDGGLRSLSGGIGGALKTAGSGISLTDNGLNNDWHTKTMKPAADLKLGFNLNRRWDRDWGKMGMIAAINYTNEYRRYSDMINNLFGVYDTENDRSNYLRQSVDDQYNHNVRLGAMLNLTWITPSGLNKYQFKNIFNQIGNDRYTARVGKDAQSNNEQSAEYYYRSRSAYEGQFTGNHTLDHDKIDWSASYSYANRHLPDRRRYVVNDALEAGKIELTAANDISREWTQLDEHIFSLGANDTHAFTFGDWHPTLKFGLYGERRSRKYNTREFVYSWNTNDNSLPTDFRSMDMEDLLSDSQYFGTDKLYMLELQRKTNDYEGRNTLGAGYAAVTLPLGRLSVYAGLRYEYNDMELISNTRDTEVSHKSRHYRYNDLFPSANLTYKFNDEHQLRLSYGKTVNRPEFRELSSSVYYDFDLASNVQGNTELKNCYVQNVDQRYEFYPSRGESVSLALFYKHFDSPIEWTYTVAGGTDLVYSYENAKSAKTYGVELDIRKSLDFIGLDDFSWVFNGALIKSRVDFAPGSREENRPMQGQSPYLVNTGFFYTNDRLKLNVALLYNRIGKRIIGVGRSDGTTGGNEVLRVPDSYEMPRDVIDLSASKMFGNHWEVKLNVRDLLAQKVYYKQFADVSVTDGTTRKDHSVTQVTRCYKPGRNFGISAVYKF